MPTKEVSPFYFSQDREDPPSIFFKRIWSNGELTFLRKNEHTDMLTVQFKSGQVRGARLVLWFSTYFGEES